MPNSARMPEAWDAPTGFVARLTYRVICLCLIGQADLAIFWREIDEHDEWINLHARHRALSTLVLTLQAVVMAAAVVFLTTSPPVSFADYTDSKAYGAFSSAFVMSLAGIAFQFSSLGIFREVPRQILPADELLNSRRAILTYLLRFRFPYLFALLSLSFLTAGFMLAWPATFSYLIGLILFCGFIIVLSRCCLPADSWVVPVVAALFVLIMIAYFFVLSLVPMNIP
ncbi:hypothetical protein BKA82DRAFT_995324 [Pisolithus tinctorius]|uniref:Uncharacterized protein n=1 Tax=Pisolithus tinctorius Marx 270 TaxID=870435 RepID=A0A0C3KMR4_PISTI|nr:hypothetical protein BKA82DRAFT_995324 [Pisolithus tinctorius]KIO10872.1 hypothetical protein M404DRAFT_995324 [Pisolithus tinctorius Marx 270]